MVIPAAHSANGGAALLAKPDAVAVLKGTLVPTVAFNKDFLGIVVAVIGNSFRAIGVKLRRLGAAGERGRRGVCTGDRRRDGIEITNADLALVPRGGVAGRLGGKLGLLQLAVGCHAVFAVAARQLEHRQVETVKPGQSYELKAVADAGDVALEGRQLCLR